VRDEGGERTYGIWGFVALFSLLTLMGVVLLLVSGGSDRGTTQVSSPQTLPATTSTTSTSTAPTSTAPTSSVPTAASEVDLPEGVTDVLREDGATSYVFAAPADIGGSSLEAAVAPMGVRLADDGRTATLTVGCVRSSEEVLAQVLVTEGEQSVTFAAITVAPPDAPPCPTASEDPRTVELTLDRPLDGRSVVVVPAGTEVPPLRPA
jgi:hypothetical protein